MEEEKYEIYYEHLDDGNHQSSPEFKPYFIRFIVDEEEVMLI